MSDQEMAEFLDWIADRLVYVHGENPRVDYMLRLRRCVGELRGQHDPAVLMPMMRERAVAHG